jgi:hypothetical protein
MMPLIDELLEEIDVDAALEEVLSRHEHVDRWRRQARVVLVAACVVALAGVGWLAWNRGRGNESLDVVGDPQSDATSASVTADQGDGVLMTLSVDDDQISVGDSVQIEITVANTGTATLLGAWDQPVECLSSVGLSVRSLRGEQVLSVGNLDHGDNNWFVPREEIGTSVAVQTDVQPGLMPEPREVGEAPGAVVVGALSEPLSLQKTCPEEPALQPLGPGEEVTLRATWEAWLSAGALAEDGAMRIDAVPNWQCSECSHLPPDDFKGSSFPEEARLPIRVDPASRTAPPSPDQLVAAVERDDVQTILDEIGPRLDAGAEPVYGGWLLQIDDRWLQRIQGGAGAVDIWFGEDGEVLEVQHKTGDGVVTPPGP